MAYDLRLLYVAIALTIVTITSVHSLALTGNQAPRARNANEDEAIEFLERYNEEFAVLLNNSTLKAWAYNTNITEENAKASTEADLILAKYSDEAYAEAEVFDPTDFSENTKRQLRYVGSKSLSDEKMERLATLISEMGSIYGEGKVCRPSSGGGEECLPLEPDLTELLASSRDPAERLWAWEGWRREVAQKIKPRYLEYVTLKNELAELNGYDDYGDQLRKKYEIDTFASDVQALYDEMKPLYMQLHAYIRRKLYQAYGPEVVSLTGTLPQHLLGDMWGRFWNNLYSIAVPYPDQPALDVTPELIRQNYTVRRMFETGDEFFTSMGLLPVPNTFYNLSMLERPEDGREVICHATAWDFYDARDFRIKMCTKITFDDFLTIHHELGHIQYFMQYAGQPTVYRDGANDGFHEAVGELISMCVSTPKHLETLNLLDTSNIDLRKTEINYLLSMALTSVSTLPFHYLNDLWRWRAFAGEYPNVEDWNTEFWKLSEEIVGVHAPAPRTADDLDCPSIFHVAQDYDMIRYFTRTILQFQFAESLCDAAGHTGPLNECDFYGSQEAGAKLADMLQLGSSMPWPDALEALTGDRRMQARAIRSYFKPLEEWLMVMNWINGDSPGWTPSSASPTSQ